MAIYIKASLQLCLFNFDVNLEIKEDTQKGSEAEVGSGSKVLSIINVKGSFKGHLKKEESEKSVHNVKFTIPNRH